MLERFNAYHEFDKAEFEFNSMAEPDLFHRSVDFCSDSLQENLKLTRALNAATKCILPKIDAALNDKLTIFEQSQQTLGLAEVKNYQSHNFLLLKSNDLKKKKNESPKAELPLRKDICFKNLFRAPKKYYRSLFKLHSEFFELTSKSERKKVAYSELNNFVQTYFIDKDEFNLLNGLTNEDLVHLVGRIVIPEYMSKEKSTYIYRRECDLLHDCIYRYNQNYASKLYQSKYRLPHINISVDFIF